MKKILYTGFLLTIILLSNTYLFGQSVNNKWILYPNSVNLNLPTPVVNLLSGADPNTTDLYADANGAFNNEGNLLFYVVDGEIYNNLGAFVENLAVADPLYSLPMRETSIVPVPENINKFYIIYSKGCVPQGQDVLYTTVDCSNGTCVIINNGNLLQHYVYGNNNGIAVSRLYDNNTRRMYVASNDFVKRYEINSNGIFFQENIMEYPNNYGLASWDFDALQLDLSNDGSKLVWCSSLNFTTDLPHIHIIDLNDAGGFVDYYNVLISDSNFQPTWANTIKGVKISSDNSKVYCTVSLPQEHSGLFCYDFSSTELTNIVYDAYGFSQLQSDAKGFIYVVSNDGTNLGRIDPNTNTFIQSYLVINILSDGAAGGWNFYSLPDLINYRSIVLNVTSTYETCASESDGTATVTVNGGTPPYTYLWDDPAGQTTPTAVGLSPDIYSCTVTDAVNDSKTISVEISTDPSLFTYIGDWEVYTNDGVTGLAAIDGTIDVFDGGTFTIDGTVEFNTNSSIIVHNGGTLIINENSVLSGLTACNNNYWGGIDIEEQGNLVINNGVTISKGNLIIEKGALVSLEQKTIYFDNNKVVIKPGGELNLQNSSLITATGYTWQGIQVWGNSTASQFPYPDPNGSYQQGYLELNNATIENAVVAVDLWNPGDYSTTGGIVHSYNTNYINCAKSVHALYYKNHNPYDPDQTELAYNATFKLDTFEITANYPGAVKFYKHVDLSHVKGIDFKGCYFSCDASATNVSGYKLGIAAYNAGFNVEDVCSAQIIPCPENDRTPCTFNGFYSGVLADEDGTDITYTFNVYNAEFVNNIYGVKATQYQNFTVLNSNFQIGYNNSAETVECVNAAGYGIWMNQCTGFAVEENHFSKYSGAPTALYTGISIANTNATDEVYKNYFEGLSYAEYAEGYDWKPGYTYLGLAYYCNQNDLNYADFYVENNGQSGIQSEQGYLDHSTGNTFSPNATYDFFNGGEHLVGYYYCNSCTSETPDINKVFHVVPYAVNVVNTCNSHYGGDIRGNLVLSAQQRLTAEQQYSNNLADYNSVKALYDNLIDGGSTSSEISDIENAQPSEMWTLRTQLLGDSPHLSMDVLKKTADRTDVFPDATIFDILAANPDELKKDELIKYLEEKDNPLPQYMIDILQQLAYGTTYKTVLQQQMARYNQSKTRAAHDIIRSILNDSIVNYTDLRNWLDNLGGITSERQIISSYIHQGNFTDAMNLANMLPQLYNLKGVDSIEHLYYMDMLALYDTLYIQGRKTTQLDSNEIAQVVTISDSSRDVAGAQARSILESVYDYHFTKCPQFVDSTAGYKAGAYINSDALAKVYGLEISAKPNPASQWTAFDYVLRNTESKATIEITDLSGRTIARFMVTGKQGQKVWDIRKIPSGAYLYTLKTEGIFKTGKLIINK